MSEIQNEKRSLHDPVERAERDIKESMANRPLDKPRMPEWERRRQTELEDKAETMHGSRGRFGRSE